MKKRMHFKKIKHHLIVSFSIIILLSLCLSTYYFLTAERMNAHLDEVINKDYQRHVTHEKLLTHTEQQTRLVRDYLLYGDSQYSEAFEANQEAMQQLEDSTTISGSSDLDTVMDSKALLATTLDDVIQTYDRGQTEEALDLFKNEAISLETEVITQLESLLADSDNHITAQGQTMIANGKMALMVAAIGIILFIVLSIVIEWRTIRVIARPIEKVTNRMKQIAQGKLGHQPLETNFKNEIGQLNASTNDVNNHMEKLIQQTGEVLGTVNSQSEDLSQAANEVKAGTEQVAVTMQELADGAETQATHASELAANMGAFAQKVTEANNEGELIGQASNEILAMTNEGSDLMASSASQMEKIYQIVKESVENVNTLDTQSSEISNLVEVVQDIAEQTNLLALNAAIEAARAGEHGKGFSVVANEVKNLAEQVSDSIKEITDIVASIQENSSVVSKSLQSSYHEVAEGTKQLETTQETFDGIRLFVTEMANTINRTASSLSEIEAQSQQMNGSIQDVAAIAEESAAGIEQTTASAQQTSSSMDEISHSSEQLATSARELTAFAQKFHLEEKEL